MIAGTAFNSQNSTSVSNYNAALGDISGEYPFPDPAWASSIMRDDENRESVSAIINDNLLLVALGLVREVEVVV